MKRRDFLKIFAAAPLAAAIPAIACDKVLPEIEPPREMIGDSIVTIEDIIEMKKVLDANDVPEKGRWAIDPYTFKRVYIS